MVPVRRFIPGWLQSLSKRQPVDPYAHLRPPAWDLDALRELQRAAGAPTVESARSRLAVVTPLPPKQTGVATYAKRMIDALSQIADVTAFDISAQEEFRLPEAETLRVLPMNLLQFIEETEGPFDQVIYFIGNSGFHMEAVSILEQRSGVVLLHDAQLADLYAEMTQALPELLPCNSLPELRQTFYPGIGGEIAYLRPVIDAAEAVIVHSEAAAEIVATDAGLRPVALFPHPCPPRPSVLVERADSAIGSFGFVQEDKRPADLLAAVAQLGVEVSLIFAGGCDADLQLELLSVSENLGLGGRVTFTGHIPMDQLRELQQSVTIAVQLRSQSRGESSGVIAELLSCGTPTVVTELGAQAELPPSAVRFLAPDVSPSEIARAVDDLLSNTARRQQLTHEGLEYVRANSYEQAASRLLEFVL